MNSLKGFEPVVKWKDEPTVFQTLDGAVFPFSNLHRLFGLQQLCCIFGQKNDNHALLLPRYAFMPPPGGKLQCLRVAILQEPQYTSENKPDLVPLVKSQEKQKHL